jgi:hypothetical protein
MNYDFSSLYPTTMKKYDKYGNVFLSKNEIRKMKIKNIFNF